MFQRGSLSHRLRRKPSIVKGEVLHFFVRCFLVVILVALASYTYHSSVERNSGISRLERLSSAVVTDVFNLADSLSYEGLPVASVESHAVPDARGTVIFIPQYHLNPSSAAADSINDSAERAQQQIFDVLATLVNKAGIDFVMMEGELYGEVPTQEIDKVAWDIEQRNHFAKQYQSLKDTLTQDSLDGSLEQGLFAQLDRELATIDRTIVLEGAPLRLAAKHEDVQLWGLENEATREESKPIVRDYVYLNDRLKELQSGQVASSRQRSAHLFQARQDSLWQLLSALAERPVEADLRRLEELAQTSGRDNVAALSREVSDLLTSLKKSTESNQAVLAAPDRQDNPYRNVGSARQLKQQLAEVEKKIEEIVVDKRNAETAENVAAALQEKGKTVGVVQFGAGHVEGLVDELNKKALSVIVVTPTEVANRALGQ